ncbi:MAG: phenylalanine--tRNA ligase subunit beta [Clostridiales bacterium]|nr:phenylalanine--tRNA ligase subunit beta [Clostridiales bacterium]
MKVPLSWLKEFVDIEISIQELADKLVSCGFEIEEIIYMRDNIKNVVVGKILTLEPHTNSNHLSICKVDVGESVIQIVTGANNVKVGDLVPVALDNAVLIDGTVIKTGELRGVVSQGMLCSGQELDLTEDDFAGAGVNGILILSKNAKIGQDINDIIGNTEVVLDVDVTANRPDCNSILGIAREVAAVTGKELKLPEMTYRVNNESVHYYVTVENKAFDLCPRYMAAAVKNVIQMTSPKIIRDRLKAVGVRPINNLVDITNYVLFELGQPMHAFDIENLSGRKIVIRRASGEKIVALDGKEYKLDNSDLAICDSEKPIAIAGVMGGEYSSICDTTTTVILESARFARDSVRHTSRKLNLKSDSSQRFEKGIDYISQELGMKRALALFDKYGWGEVVSGCIDEIKESYEDRVITYNYQEINKIIGKEIPKEAIIDILNALTLITTSDGNILKTCVPNYREDIVGVNDITEEVIRIYGYDIVEANIYSNTKGGMTPEQMRMEKLKDIMVGKGAFEIISYSFIPPKAFDMLNVEENSDLRKAISLSNPLGVDFSIMRTTLSYSMIKTIAYNLARNNKECRLFELAKIYLPKSLPLTELPVEKYNLSIGVFGEKEDYYTLKAIIDDIMLIFGIEVSYERKSLSYLHTGRSASILANGKEIGVLGEIHPDVLDNFDIDKKIYIAELDAEYVAQKGIDIKPYKAVSRYQGMERDLALIVPIDMAVSQLLSQIKSGATSILDNLEVFDVYQGKQIGAGKKSVAIKLFFQEYTRTLTDNEVNLEIENILSKLKEIDVHLR